MAHDLPARGATIRLAGASVWYSKDIQALRDIDLELTSGTTALVGVNGAGKSTLMSVVAGGLRPTDGSVTMDEVNLYGRRRRGALRRVALMPQFLTMPKSLTTLEAVSVLAWMRGLPGKTVRARSIAALEAVDLASHTHRKVKELSGGMLRRVALAQAIVADPDVLLLDEPSTGLDPQQRRGMVELVKRLSGTVIFSSHLMEDVMDVADRVVVLHEGIVRFDGSLDSLKNIAPNGTAPGRQTEAAFLELIADRKGTAHR